MSYLVVPLFDDPLVRQYMVEITDGAPYASTIPFSQHHSGLLHQEIVESLALPGGVDKQRLSQEAQGAGLVQRTLLPLYLPKSVWYLP